MLSNKKIIAVAAMDENRVIGNKGKLPDRNAPEDMAFFRKEITGKTIVMGRKTYEGIYIIYKDKYPEIHGHPLAKKSIIITHREISGALTAKTLQEVIQLSDDKKIRVIGGAEIYKLFLPYTDTILLTKVHGKYQGDTFFPEFEEEFRLIEEKPSHDGTCDFCRYERVINF